MAAPSTAKKSTKPNPNKIKEVFLLYNCLKDNQMKHADGLFFHSVLVFEANLRLHFSSPLSVSLCVCLSVRLSVCLSLSHAHTRTPDDKTKTDITPPLPPNHYHRTTCKAAKSTTKVLMVEREVIFITNLRVFF